MKAWELREENGAVIPDKVDCRSVCDIGPGHHGLIWVINEAGQAYWAARVNGDVVPLHEIMDYDGMGG